MRKPDPMTLAAQVEGKKLPPVDQWNPPLSGDMDMRIARDGTWFHEGTAIERIQLARMFSTILRRDEDDCYYLVTPVEKWRITVDDAPFVAVLLETTGQGEQQNLCFTTNLGDRVDAGAEHPIVVEYTAADGTPAPYVHIRGRLRALIARSVFLELAELGEERDIDGEKVYGVWSQGQFFALGKLEEDH